MRDPDDKVFRVWCPEEGAHADSPCARSIVADTAETAAERFVEIRHADMDYPTELTVLVMGDKGTSEWTVEARQEVTFYASQKK